MKGTVSAVENIRNCESSARAMATPAAAAACQNSLARAVRPRLRR